MSASGESGCGCGRKGSGQGGHRHLFESWREKKMKTLIHTFPFPSKFHDWRSGSRAAIAM